ncbi:hypothetical protein GGG16DRAFT_55641 [Schizophyllum commune]
MLVSALEHRDAIAQMFRKEEVVQEIELFELSRHEWKCAEQLRDALEHATEYFSRAGSPNLPFVIVAMDQLDEQLTTITLNTALEPAIRAAANLAKQTLNCYYSLTDQADAYRVSMVLHPRRKLEYFETAGWTKEWILAAEALTRDIYTTRYLSREVQNDIEQVVPAPKVRPPAVLPALCAHRVP